MLKCVRVNNRCHWLTFNHRCFPQSLPTPSLEILKQPPDNWGLAYHRTWHGETLVLFYICVIKVWWCAFNTKLRFKSAAGMTYIFCSGLPKDQVHCRRSSNAPGYQSGELPCFYAPTQSNKWLFWLTMFLQVGRYLIMDRSYLGPRGTCAWILWCSAIWKDHEDKGSIRGNGQRLAGGLKLEDQDRNHNAGMWTTSFACKGQSSMGPVALNMFLCI